MANIRIFNQPMMMSFENHNVAARLGESVVIEIEEGDSEQLRDILQQHVPDFLELFIKKNREYGSGEQSSGTYLGSRGQFADIWRKIGKLKIGLWDQNEDQLTTESTDEILRDMIGHCLLSLHLRGLERSAAEAATAPSWPGRAAAIARATAEAEPQELRDADAPNYEADDPDPERFADDWDIARHAEKQEMSWADAWRYFERQGYDMSKASPQYEG